jgi:hypothetical protein
VKVDILCSFYIYIVADFISPVLSVHNSQKIYCVLTSLVLLNLSEFCHLISNFNMKYCVSFLTTWKISFVRRIDFHPR